MSRFFKTTWTLFKKDIKDTLRNTSLLIMLLLPPIFAILFRTLSMEAFQPGWVLLLVTVMSVCMIPLSFLATIIAEEKEKFTLRTLMLSGVSAPAFIVSKILATWLLMEIVNVVDFILVGYDLSMLPMFILITTLGALCLFLIGAAIGMLSRDQMSTNILSLPVLIVLLLPSMLGLISTFFSAISEFSPVEHMMRLFYMWEGGQPIFSPEGWKGIIVILAWIVLGIAVYWLAYKKKRLDK